MQSLRQRQIDEIRNHDLNINKQVVAALNKQVSTFDETVAPPTTDQAVNTDRLLNLIDNFNVETVAEIEDTERAATAKDVEFPGLHIGRFNEIMRLRSSIIKNNYNSKNLINQQMQTMIPPINSFIIGFNDKIEKYITHGPNPSGGAAKIARFYSVLAIAEAIRGSLVTGSYRPIEITDVDTTFNKMIQKLPNDYKNIVLLGLTKSPMSGFNRGNGEGYEEAKHRLESELGRPLTKSDDLMLAIRMGNFSQFKPILSNTQISALNDDKDPRNPVHFVGPDTNLEDEWDVQRRPPPVDGRPRPVFFPEGFIPQAVPHTALENERNEDQDPQRAMSDISDDDRDPRNPVHFVGPDTELPTDGRGRGRKHKREDTNNTDLHYRDDRNEDPYEAAGKGKSILSRFA